MSLPATDVFTGSDGDHIDGRTTTTGGLTWAYATGGSAADWQVNTNRAYNSASGAAIVLLNPGATDIDQQIDVKSATGELVILVFRSNSGGTTFLQAWFEMGSPGRVRVFDESLTQIGTTWTSGNIVQNDTCRVTVSGSAITCYVNATTTVSTSSSHGSSNTYVGLRGGNSNTLLDNYSLAAFAVVDPAAAVSKFLPTGNIFTGGSGSRGTGPYTQQWQRSTAPNSGYANLSNGLGISGATTLTLTDGSATALTGVELFYRLVVTDSLAATFTSNTIGTVLGKKSAYSLVIGDSVEAGNGGVDSPRLVWLDRVRSLYGPRESAVYNASSGGQATTHWFDSAGSGAQAQLATDLSAGLANTPACTVCEIRLGINDASSGRLAAVYSANLAGIAAAAITAGYSRVIIHYPTGIASPTVMAVMVTYPVVIDALANGTTIFVGDKQSFYWFAARPDLTQDGTHPTVAGNLDLSQLTALGTALGLGDAPGVSTDAGIANIRSGTNYTFNGSSKTGTLAVPATNKVLTPEAVDATTGTLTLPMAAQALTSATFGVGGNSITGTVTLPAAGFVLSGTTFGAGGATSGTYVVVATANVRFGTAYGAASALTGTLAVPTASNVLSGVSVDAGTGTYVTVATGGVKIGTAYGAGSALTGTYDGSDRWTDPSVSNVLSGVVYKANATSNNRTGTLTGGGGTIPAVSDVRFGVTVGAAQTGTLVVPSTVDVRASTSYGAGGAEFTGSLAVPSASVVLTGNSVDATTGTYVAVATSNVKTAVTFGTSSGLTGTYTGADRWTDPGIANVLTGVVYKSNSTTNNRVGTLVISGGVVPSSSDVRLGVTVGVTTGTLVVPSVGDVRLSVGYGAGGVEFVGTLDASGGSGSWDTVLETAGGNFTAGQIMTLLLAEAFGEWHQTGVNTFTFYAPDGSTVRSVVVLSATGRTTTLSPG